jgi:5-methylthioadenosine/S-adenosylhomocysteine deaminase
MAKILLKGGEVYCPDGTARQADILIDGENILQVGQVADTAAEIIDCTNKLAVPGFINAHNHAAMTLFRSYADDLDLMDWLQNKIWPAEDKLTGEDVYWGTMLAIAEMLKSGTTTFADMYFFMPEVAKAVQESGCRAVLARGMAGVSPAAEKALQESEAFFQEWHNSCDGRITVMLGPHAPYTCPPAYLKRVIELAGRLKAEIHIHLAETAGEVANCQKEHGKSPIELVNELGLFEFGTLAAHCVHLSDRDLEILRQKKVRVAHNPGSNMKLASGVAPVTKMLAQGVCVALGTDGASSNNNLDMLEEIRLAATLHKTVSLDPLAIPAKDALNMATRNGAKALGLEKITGQIAPGFKADITLFEMNAPHWYPRHDVISLLTYAANSADVHTVIVNGKILLKNRSLTTIDEERLIFEVKNRKHLYNN